MTFEIYMEDCKFAARQAGLQEGREQGLLEGREEGLHQGREQGLLEGIKEQQNKTARTMLKKGMDAGLISEITGLTAEEIAALQQE